HPGFARHEGNPGGPGSLSLSFGDGGAMSRHVYLRKANNDLVSHCACAQADALVTAPSQMDCPWCGCGWLFICSRCRKAFTFAERAHARLIVCHQVDVLDLHRLLGLVALGGFLGRHDASPASEVRVSCATHQLRRPSRVSHLPRVS